MRSPRTTLIIDTVSRIQNTFLVILPSSNTFGLFSDLQLLRWGAKVRTPPLRSILSRESQSGDPHDWGKVFYPSMAGQL